VKSIYSTDTLRKPDSQEKPLSAFFEPDIVVFTKVHIVLKNSELPVQREEPEVKISKLLKLPSFPTRSFILIPSRDTYDEDLPSDDSDDPPSERYFFFTFRRVAKPIKEPIESAIQCPEGQECAGFKGGYKLTTIGDDRKIETPGLYLLSINADGMPFFKEPGSKLEPTEKTEEVEEIEEEIEEEKKEEEVEEIEEEEEETVTEEPFVASPLAIQAKEEQTFELDNVKYRIRIPYEKAVKEDWLKGVYTENEVVFLKSLKFTPKLLSDTFGTNYWKPRLADFLEKVVNSNCFNDVILLTKAECSNSQQFIKEIYLEMYKKSLERLYSKFGYSKPELLEDILLSLKRIATLGPAKGKDVLTKFLYTGDILNRFQVINYNKETGEYFADFVDMPEETRSILNKLKLYRVTSGDLNEIMNAIAERLNVPFAKAQEKTEELYSLKDIQENDSLPQDLFELYATAPDGLCFYRVVLKSKLPEAIGDSKESYIPTKEESLRFVSQIKQYLTEHKKDLLVKPENTPVEEYFNARYAPQDTNTLPKDVPATEVSEEEKKRRVRVGDVYKRIKFEEFLNFMDLENDFTRPYAEVHDAAIGPVAGILTNSVIVIYQKVGDTYRLRGLYNEEILEIEKRPLSSFIFLVHVNGNHYNLLKVKKDRVFPHAPTVGGAEEVFDLGEPVRNKKRKTRKNSKKL